MKPRGASLGGCCTRDRGNLSGGRGSRARVAGPWSAVRRAQRSLPICARASLRLDRALVRPVSLERDLKRLHRYNLSYKFLTGKLGEDDYRRAMADYG